MQLSLSPLLSHDFSSYYEEAVEPCLEGKPELPGQHPP